MIYRFFILSVIGLLYSCNLSSLKGTPGVNDNIEASKKRGVYISEYVVNSNPLKINDSISILVKSAWLEKTWFYDGLLNEKTIIWKEGVQMRVISDTTSIKGLSKFMMVRKDNQEGFFLNWSGGGEPYALTAYFNKVPTTDTVVWDVYTIANFNNNGYRGKFLGKFILLKK